MRNFLKTFFARAVGVLAVLLIGVMLYSATTDGTVSAPATLLGAAVTPAQTLTATLVDGFSGFFSRLFSGDQTARIRELEAENAALRQKIVDYDAIKQQNEYFNEILGLHEQHSDFTFASGRVIGREPSDPYGNFTVSAGKNAGIAVSDPVVSTDGSLVGVVEEVGLTFCKVRSVLDPANKVSAQISRTADTAYTAGGTVEQAKGRILRLNALDRASGAAIGDYVITSGIGGVYPSGLLIGTVETVAAASDGMTLSAEVKLFADLFDLKQVMVITAFDGQNAE